MIMMLKNDSAFFRVLPFLFLASSQHHIFFSSLNISVVVVNKHLYYQIVKSLINDICIIKQELFNFNSNISVKFS